MSDLDQQIRAILNGYDHDAAGQIDDLTGAIRAVLDLLKESDISDAPDAAVFMTEGIRASMALSLGIITPEAAQARLITIAHRFNIDPERTTP